MEAAASFVFRADADSSRGWGTGVCFDGSDMAVLTEDRREERRSTAASPGLPTFSDARDSLVRLPGLWASRREGGVIGELDSSRVEGDASCCCCCCC